MLAAAASGFSGAKSKASELSVEGYIFQQYAEARKKPLADVVDEVLPMARQAGFRNIELNPAFLAPELRGRVVSILRSQKLSMPSVYVGGALHDRASAQATIAKASEMAEICRPFGCTAIVNNPDPKPGGALKTDSELAVQADSLNRLGHLLAQKGFELRVHHHTPQLENQAREWRHILNHTDPASVALCVDVDWAYEGGFDPLSFLSEAGPRVKEIHVRSARNKIWLEDLEDSDIDYYQIAVYLQREQMYPLIVVELAYRTNTVITRPLEQDLQLSRSYAERVFGLAR